MISHLYVEKLAVAAAAAGAAAVSPVADPDPVGQRPAPRLPVFQ